MTPVCPAHKIRIKLRSTASYSSTSSYEDNVKQDPNYETPKKKARKKYRKKKKEDKKEKIPAIADGSTVLPPKRPRGRPRKNLVHNFS